MTERKAALRLPPFTSFVLIAAGMVLCMFHDSHGAVLVTLALSTILLIIFGERLAIDEILETHNIPGRDAIIPVIALGMALGLGAVSPDTLPRVFGNKIDIICLILSFAIVSEGIARSGYFAFAAYKIVSKCHGNTTRLIVYLYVLASLLAFFTSNDIVILVLTPVIFSICVHARIQNTRLLLMSQFVAANTMSMGTLIGSPTNIIFGNALNMNFFSYLFMMVVPAFLCGALSLIVIDWVNRQSRPGTTGFFVKRWAYEDTYRIPASIRYAHFTGLMKTWLILFGLAVALLAVVSSLHKSLLLAAAPIALASLFVLYRGKREETSNSAEAAKDIRQVLQSLPYSIFFFGMTFFAFSDELARLDFTQNVILPFVREHLLNDVVRASFSMLIVSGGLVNTINDLPASALLSDILLHINVHGGALNEYLRLVVMQAILVGLNIGCYVTPIGALAGLMWFNIIRREERRLALKAPPVPASRGAPAQKMLTPSRGDLVAYGLMHFAFVSFVIGYILPFFVHIVDMLVSSPSLANETALPDLISIRHYLPYIGIGLLAFTLLSARGVLNRSGVLLGHMREVFVVMTRVTIWTMKNRLLYLIILGSILLACASGLLYWAETAHERIFGLTEGSKPLFDSLSSFLIWAMVFSGAGLSDAYKPHSALGMALTSIMPVLVIGGIVLIAQLSSQKTIQDLAKRMASGDIPGYRIVVINFHNRFEKFVETMLHNRVATILLLCCPLTYDRAVAFCARLDAKPWSASRVYAALKHADASYSIEEYRIDQADEIYLLSDMTVLGEYDKIRYVTKLDFALNTIRSAMAEGIETGSPEDDAEKGQGIDIDNLEGVPKIFIESCAARYHGLMQKASSSLFLRTTTQMTFDSDISDLLMSDMDESLASLNQYYKLGRAAPSAHLFQGGVSPLARTALADFELEEEGKILFRRHFSGPAIDAEDMPYVSQDSPTFQQSSTLARSQIGARTSGARYLDGEAMKVIDAADLLGVIADVAGSQIHLSIPSAALSMQPVNVERIVLRQPYKEGSPAALPMPVIRTKGHRIFIFNLSQLARAFVRKLLPLFAAEKEPRIVLLCSQTQFVPEDIKNSPCVHILQSDHMEALVQQICPTLEERAVDAGAPGQGFSPLLQKGDRLYGFLEHDSQNSEAGSIDFIDLLDTQLRQLVVDAARKGAAAPISHPEVYIAMEAIGADSRFMMENFYIDKIIDTSMPRLNYLETLAKLFHRIASDKSAAHTIEGTVFNFRRAAEIAAYLCHFTVALAEDIRLKDDVGTEISLLGKTMAAAGADMRAYSMPPVQLFGRVRVESEPYKSQKYTGRTFCLVEIPESEPIRKGDLLLNIPVI